MIRSLSWLAALVLLAVAGRSISWAQAPGARQITGQVRLGNQPAPAGVPVVLQIVSSRYATPSREAEVARTLTDRKGGFTFDHLETVGANGGREFFAVSAQWPGYERAAQVSDLTFAARGEVTLHLERAKERKPGETTADSASEAAAAGVSRRSLNPEAREAISRAQDLLFRQHDPAASIEEFKKALQSDPWFGPGYVLLGLAYMQLRQWSQAQLAFSEAAKVEPGNLQAYLGMGSAMN